MQRVLGEIYAERARGRKSYCASVARLEIKERRAGIVSRRRDVVSLPSDNDDDCVFQGRECWEVLSFSRGASERGERSLSSFRREIARNGRWMYWGSFFLYVRCVEIDCFFFSKNGWSFEMNG